MSSFVSRIPWSEASPDSVAADPLLLDSLRVESAGRAVKRSSSVRAVQEILTTLTPLAWCLAVGGFLAFAVGRGLGWPELYLPAAGAVVAVLFAAVLSLRTIRCSVELSMSQQRVPVGTGVQGRVTVRSLGATGRGLQLRIRVGNEGVVTWIPRLKRGEVFEDIVDISTDRRGKFTVGPVQVVRSDGLGIIRRVHAQSGVGQLYVYPRTVALDAQMIGFIHDIEGIVTQDLASSDVSFRSLREYQPGDDRRSIHWKASAHYGNLLVRQFDETRRSHVLVVFDTRTEAWVSTEEFEQGVSVAASLCRASMRSSVALDLVMGERQFMGASAYRLMDELCAVEMDASNRTLVSLTRGAVAQCPQASTLVVVSGSGYAPSEVSMSLGVVGTHLRAFGVRLCEDGAARLVRTSSHLLMELPDVDHLNYLLTKATS